MCEDGLPHAFENKGETEYQGMQVLDYEGDADGLELIDNPDNEGSAKEVILDDLEGGS